MSANCLSEQIAELGNIFTFAERAFRWRYIQIPILRNLGFSIASLQIDDQTVSRQQLANA